MKILLDGAAGFLGRHLDRFLRAKYTMPEHSIYRVVRRYSQSGLFDFVTDIKHSTEVKWVLQEYQPDVIIHLAANPRGKPDENNPLSIFEDNVLGTLNLLEHSPKNCHFINASSITVYGDTDRADEFDPPAPTSLYSLSKQMAEDAVNRYDRLNKIRATNLRLCALVGPPAGLTHGFIKDLILKIKSNNPELPLIGKAPGAIKPFLHIDDACNAIYHAVENKIHGTFNICPDDNISVEDVAKLAMEHYGIQKEIIWEDKVWEGDNPFLSAYNTHALECGFTFKHETSYDAIKAALNEF